jgi:hypothetical protein
MTSLEFEQARSNRESDHTVDFAAGVFVLVPMLAVAFGYFAWRVFA